jgi:hypothetical protein
MAILNVIINNWLSREIRDEVDVWKKSLEWKGINCDIY